MKRFLLVPAFAATLLAANAEAPTPQLFMDACINAISPNGKMAASEMYDMVEIMNLETGETYIYEPDYEIYPPKAYTIGLGRCISDNGIVTGMTGMTDAEYWKDGEWHLLNRGVATGNYHAYGITPDGSRICGIIGVNEGYDGVDAMMQIPVIWEWDGTDFGKPKVLPHPLHDITGRVGQYCTAIEISDDGKTVVGQLVDGFGLMRYPVVYREDADGNWTYEIVHQELLNPNGIEIPEYPGEGPEWPMIDDYMTPEQIEAFYIALNVWYEENPESEMDLLETLMFAEDFMDPEQFAACWEVTEAFVEWSNRLDEWNGLYDQICEDSPRYVFNDIHMSPEGNAFAVNVNNGSPYVFSLDSDEYTHLTKFGNKNVTYFASEGRLIVNTDRYSGSWIIENDTLIDLSEWIVGKVPAYGDWMEENDFYNGVATATPDLGKVGFWEELGDGFFFARGVVFDIAAGMESGVGSNVAAPIVEGPAYDIHGRVVKDMTAPGIYIVNGKKVMVTK